MEYQRWEKRLGYPLCMLASEHGLVRSLVSYAWITWFIYSVKYHIYLFHIRSHTSTYKSSNPNTSYSSTAPPRHQIPVPIYTSTSMSHRPLTPHPHPPRPPPSISPTSHAISPHPPHLTLPYHPISSQKTHSPSHPIPSLFLPHHNLPP